MRRGLAAASPRFPSTGCHSVRLGQRLSVAVQEDSVKHGTTVIRMLFVVVAEFFVCWAPLHVLNTWYLFSPEVVYKHVGSTGVSLVQLLAYISSCCNPITYCFMNRKFRQSFLGIFDCYHCLGGAGSCPSRLSGAPRDGAGVCAVGNNNSDVSGNESTVFAGRASGAGRSGPRTGHVVEAPGDDDESFRYRITWKSSGHPHPQRINNPTPSSSSSCARSISFSDLYS
uniref:G-protein coupled receptors family 1 profile domain-containing protein n=1 Tax=Timema shepardi TaxID=629360 RepID=A0A7R9AYX8_TIMSH|nr:unnamed protein product [Timema shepardi]